MIEELMILNNILAAKELSKGINYPSRHHPEPDLEIASNSIFLLEKINNIEINKINVSSIQNLIDKNEHKLVNLYLIRSILSKATYDHQTLVIGL